MIKSLRREVNAGSEYSGSRWIVAPVNTDCTKACVDIRMVCKNSEMEKHNFEVDSAEEVLELIKKLQPDFRFKSSNTMCTEVWGKYSDIPNFSKADGICLASWYGEMKTYICNKSPTPASQKKARLCYCSEVAKISGGSHPADSCEDCPQGHGEKWCHGDCKWLDSSSKCIPK